MYLTPETMLFAVGFAAAVGVFFGYYPARKAAKLEPTVALPRSDLDRPGRHLCCSSFLIDDATRWMIDVEAQ
jgi:hypothetical protein